MTPPHCIRPVFVLVLVLTEAKSQVEVAVGRKAVHCQAASASGSSKQPLPGVNLALLQTNSRRSRWQANTTLLHKAKHDTTASGEDSGPVLQRANDGSRGKPGQSSLVQRRPAHLFSVLPELNPQLALALVGVLLVIAVGHCFWTTDIASAMPVSEALWARRKVQFFFILFYVLAMAQTLVVLPDSYDLAVDMGQGATFSGLLVGLSWPLQAVAIVLAIPVKSWSWASQRILIISSMLVLCVASLVYALAADPPQSWAPSQLVRGIGLIAGRVVIGPCIAFCVFLRVLAQQVTPPAESVVFNMGISLSVTLGIGLGPMVSPTAAWCLGDDDVHLRAAASSYMFALVWSLMIIFSLWCVPCDPSGLISAAREMGDSPVTGCEKDATQSEGLSESQRSRMWWGGVRYNAERTFVVAALESATVFMLETEFEWDARMAGYAVGCTFLASIPTILGLWLAKQHGLSTDRAVVQSAVLIGAGAGVFLFPMKVSASKGAVIVLTTDSVIFTMGFVANGIIDGIAIRSCAENSIYSIANYELASQFMRNVLARSLAPPFSRYILSTHGRGLYATIQLVISMFGCWTAIKTVNVQQER